MLWLEAHVMSLTYRYKTFVESFCSYSPLEEQGTQGIYSKLQLFVLLKVAVSDLH